MENYLGQIREMSEKQTVDIENENKKMQDQLAHILSVISNIFNDEDAGNSITDKVMHLIIIFSFNSTPICYVYFIIIFLLNSLD